MTDEANWQDENTRYLSAAIAWVRAMLEQRASLPKLTAASSSTTDAKKEPRPSLWRSLSRKDTLPPAPAPAEMLMLSAEEAKAKSSTAPEPESGSAADSKLPPPALVTLRQRLGLSRFEHDVLLLCVAMELDTSIAAMCARAQGDPTRPYPTFALALSLFDSASWDALSPERPLRHWRLLEINQPGGSTLTASQLRADEWVVNYLKGLTYLDDRLAPLVSSMPLASAEDAPDSHKHAAAGVLERLKLVTPGHRLPVIQLIGTDGASKTAVAGLIGSPFGFSLYRLPGNMVPATSPELESFARLWQRLSLLIPVALYVDSRSADDANPAQAAAIDRLLSRLDGLVFLDTRDAWRGLADSIAVDVGKPTPAEQKSAWAAALGEVAGDAPAALAGQFNLNLEQIRDIARTSLVAQEDDEPARDRLWRAALVATRPRFDNLAERIDPKATWNDIVLLPAEDKLLHQIADQVGNRMQVYQDWGFDRKTSRGLGINALFAGESGTGKTMAAEVIANHLKLDLYRIDLSAVVSKYIGETEKNLRRLFDAAEDGGAILFFDEADALFGRRSDVKDSHDRYANIEINYLLQRMESYGGLAILATNMKSALDAAFMRRLRFIVNFHFPGTAERKTIWQKAFPSETPLAEIDFDRLARLNLTGGQIALIAINAAFVAAQAGSAVTMPIVLDAARTEFRKLERPVHEPDFRWPPVRAI